MTAERHALAYVLLPAAKKQMMPKIAAGSDLREPVDVVIRISDLRLAGDLNGNMLSDGTNFGGKS